MKLFKQIKFFEHNQPVATCSTVTYEATCGFPLELSVYEPFHGKMNISLSVLTPCCKNRVVFYDTSGALNTVKLEAWEVELLETYDLTGYWLCSECDEPALCFGRIDLLKDCSLEAFIRIFQHTRPPFDLIFLAHDYHTYFSNLVEKYLATPEHARQEWLAHTAHLCFPEARELEAIVKTNAF